tara:strand:- start:22020 stop:36167 length:14148 start_codon:yes stop_codon:yes gene_type:complete
MGKQVTQTKEEKEAQDAEINSFFDNGEVESTVPDAPEQTMEDADINSFFDSGTSGATFEDSPSGALEFTNDEVEKYGDYFPEDGVPLGMKMDEFQEWMSERQGTANKLGSGITRLGLTTLTKAGAGIGYLGAMTAEATESLFTDQTFRDGFNESLDNSFSAVFDGLEENIKQELAPIFESKQYKDGSLGEQFITPEFWASDVADGLAFAFSTYIPGMALAKVGTGIKIAKGISKLAKVKDLQKIANIADRTTAWAAMSSMEAAVEAKGVRDQVYSKLKDQGMSNEKAMAIASEKAADTYIMNMAVLAPSNALEVSMLFKPLRGSKDAVKGINRSKDVYSDATKNYKGFKRFRESMAGQLSGRAAKASATEGLWEENSQLAIEHLNTHYGEAGKTSTLIDSFTELPGQMMDNLETQEGQKAILLGAIIGAPMATVTGVREVKSERARREQAIELNNAHSKFKNQSEGGVYKKKIVKPVDSQIIGNTGEAGSETLGDNYGWVRFEGEPKKRINTKEEFDNLVANGKEIIELDSKGNPIIDEAIVANIASKRNDTKNLDYLIEAAYENKDWTNYRLLRKEKFKNLAKSYFDAGRSEDLFEFLDEAANLTPEELSKLGFDGSERDDQGNVVDPKKVVQDFRKDAVYLQKQYDNIDRGTLPDSRGKESLRKYRLRKDELFNISSRQYAVKSELDRINSNISKLTVDTKESPIATALNVYENRLSKLNEDIVNYKNIVEGNRVANKDEYAPTVAEKKLPELEQELKELETEYTKYKEDNSEQIKGLLQDEFGNYRSENSIRNRDLAIEEIKKAELEGAESGLNKIYDKLMDPITGQEYFENNIAAIEKVKSGNIMQKMPKSALLFSTIKDYISYENSRIKSEIVKNKVKNVRKEFFEGGIIERLSEGESIVDIVQDIIDIKAPISNKGVNLLDEELNNKINSSQDVIDFSKTDLFDNYFTSNVTEKELEELQNKSELEPEQLEALGVAELTEEEELLLKSYIAYKADLTALENSDVYQETLVEIESLEKLKKDFKKALPEFKMEILNDTQIKENLAKEFYDKDVKGIKQDFELNPEYDNDSEVNNSIAVLNKLKETFSKRKGFSNLKKDINNKIAELKKISKEIEKRKLNRLKKQDDAQSNYTEAIYSKLGIKLTKDGYEILPEYSKLIELIKANVPRYQEILDAAQKSNFAPIYAEVLEQLIVDAALGIPEVGVSLNNILEDFIEKKKKDIASIDRFKKNVTVHGHDKQYFEKPVKSLDAVLDDIAETLISAEVTETYDVDNENSSFYKYTQDKDIVSFLKNLQKEVDNNVTPARPEILGIIKNHFEYAGLLDFKERIDNSYNIAMQNLAERTTLKNIENTPVPTKQQMISIRALNKAYNNSVTNEPFSGWSYLKGYAGTGKTNVVMRWVTHIIDDIKVPSKEIFAIGHTEHSTNGIINSLGSQTDATLENLLNLEVDEDTKLIVIDEIGAISKDNIEAISIAIAKLNENREEDNKLKTIVLGDPNQRIEGASNPLESSFQIKGDGNITVIPPLTVRYRSNVGAVVSFQDKFINQNKDLSKEPLVVRSNTSNPFRENGNFELLGVFGASDTSDNVFKKEIIEILQKRKDNSNIKAVIVNPFNKKSYREDLDAAGLNDIEVLTVEESQGRNIDEVYANIIFNKEYESDESPIRKFNTDVYTASSRATKFVFIGGMPVTQELDSEIAQDSSKMEEEVTKRKEELTKELKDSEEVIKEFYQFDEDDSDTDSDTDNDNSDVADVNIGIDPNDNLDDIIITIETDTETDDFKDSNDSGTNSTTDGVPPTSEPPTDNGQGGNHKLQNVSHSAFTNKDNAVKKDDDVQYIVVEYEDAKGNKEPSVRIVKPLGNNKYLQLGILGRDELKELDPAVAKKLQDAMNKAQLEDSYNVLNMGTDGILTSPFDITPTHRGTVSATPTKLTYVYDKNNPETLTGGVFRKIVQAFKKTFLGDSKADTKTEIRVFSELDEDYKKFESQGIYLKPGIPYLMFSNPRKSTSPRDAKPQFIRLNPRKLNNQLHKELTAPIEKFIKDIDTIDKLINSKDPSFRLGNADYNKIIKYIAKGEEKNATKLIAKYLKDGENPAKIVKSIKKLAKQIYSDIYLEDKDREFKKGDLAQRKDPNNPFTKPITTVVKGKNIIKNMPREVKVIDVSADGKQVQIKFNDKLEWLDAKDLNIANRDTPGPVQHALNIIAKSNGVIGNIPFRQYITTNSGIKTSTAKGLLVDPISPITDVKIAELSFNKEKGRKFLNKLAKRKGQTYDQFKNDLTDDQLIELANRIDGNITIEDLKKLFSFDSEGNSTAAEGFGVRMPIPKQGENHNFSGAYSKKYDTIPGEYNFSVLEYYFENTFQEVIADQITVGTEVVSSSSSSTSSTTKPNAPKKPRGRGRRGGRILASDKYTKDELGKKLSKQGAMAYLKKRLPNATEDQLKFVSDSMMHQITIGKEAWGNWTDGVISLLEGAPFTNVLRHEIFHEVFNNYLNDAERKELYKTVRAEFGIDSAIEIEELLAEQYQNYRQGEFFSTKITNFFEWLGRVFGFYADNRTEIEKLFDTIEQGKLTSYSSENLDSSRNLLRIKKDFGDIETYSVAHKKVLSSIDYYLNTENVNDDVDAMPMTKLEMFRAVAQEMVQYKEELQNLKNLTDEEIVELKAYTALADPLKYTAIIKDIYPSLNIKAGKSIANLKKIEENRIKTLDTDQQEAATNAIMENEENGTIYENFIQEGDQVNHENKILQSVKDFTALIFHGKGENETLIDSRFAFVKLVQKIPGVDFSNFNTAKTQLIAAFGNTNPQTEAILQKIIDLLDTVELEYYASGKKFPKNAEFKDVNTFVYDGGTINRGNKSSTEFYEEVLKVKSVFGKVKTRKEKLLIIKKLFIKGESANTLRELVTSLGSLREKNVKVGIQLYDYGKRDYRYVGHQDTGFITTARAVIENILPHSRTILNKHKIALEKAKESTDKVQKNIINIILKELELGSGNDNIPEHKVIVNDFLAIIENFKGFKDGEGDIVGMSGSRIDNLINVLKENTTELTVSNYIAADGTKRYMFTNSSPVLDVLKYLTTPYLKENLPKYLSSLFFKDNIFLETDNKLLKNHKILNYIDHDGIRSEDGERITNYKGENRKAWHSRNFLHGFSAILKTNRTNEKIIPAYVQQFWTISNKPNITAAEITLLSDKGSFNQVKEAIKKAVLQEMKRSPKEIKNFNENAKFSSFPTVVNGVVKYNAPIQKSKSAKDINARVEDIYAALEIKTEELLDEFIKEKVQFDDSSKRDQDGNESVTGSSKVLKSLKDRGYINDKFKDSQGLPNNINGKNLNNLYKSSDPKDIEILKNAMRPLVDLYNKNTYINGHFLNQIALGDTAYYKTGYKNSFDIIKRISIAFGIGQKGFVNEKYGMKENFTLAVGKDIEQILTNEEYRKYKKVFGKDFELSDAQGFMTPSRAENIRKGFGKGSNVQMTMKPVYFGIDENGVPVAIKYSSIELTDELIEMFPSLGKLRNRMVESGTDEFVFGSGVKLGQPTTLSEIKKGDDIHTIDPKSIVTLSNNNWRIQLNPYHDVEDQSVAHPTQLTYQSNTNGVNYKESRKLHELQSKMIALGHKIVRKKLKFGGKYTKDTTHTAVRNQISKSLEEMQGSERVLEFLDAIDKEGNPLISLNLPFIVNKVITQLSSYISKNTVKIKYDGAKLVLQSAYGTEGAKAFDGTNMRKPRWRDDKGYAEVYLPDSYKNRVQAGDTLLDKTFLGFRIPSTELHSSIPLKVIGFYPTTEKNENIIIAPSEIVFFHGSDYDIDTLYVIRREVAEREVVDTKENVLVKEGEFIGYADNKLDEDFIANIEEELKELEDSLRKARDSKDDEKVMALMKLRNELQDTLQSGLKNHFLDTFLDMIRADKNFESMMTPISMERFSGTSSKGTTDTIFDEIAFQKGFIEPKPKGKKELEAWQDRRDKVIYAPRDLNDQINQASMHQDNFSGVTLTGAFANINKSMAYMMQAARYTKDDKNAVAKLREKYHITIDGVTYDSMSIQERVAKDGKLVPNEITITAEGDTTIPTIWETLDMLINSAIDNVNEQILSVINATNITGPAYAGYVSLGIPLDRVVSLINQPIIKSISTGANVEMMVNEGLARIKGLVESKLEKDENYVAVLESVEIDTKAIKKLMEKPLEEMTKEELIQQAKVMILFNKASEIGTKAFIDPSKGLKMLQDIPTNYAALQDVTDNLDVMYKQSDRELVKDKEGNYILTGDFPFENTDILKIPHIASSRSVLLMLKNKLEHLFYKHNEELIKLSKEISNKFEIKLDKNKNKNLEIIRDEFIKYILSGVEVPIENSDYIYNFDTRNEDPYKYKHNLFTRTATGTDAWNMNFIENIELMKKTVDNKFLKGLEIKTDWKTGLKYLKFTTLSNMEQRDVLMYTDSFEKLNSDPNLTYNNFQRDFVKYSVLNQGLEFGSRNYSMILPPQMYGEISNSLDVALTNIFDSVETDRGNEKKTKTKIYNTLDKMRDHFGIQLALAKADILPKLFKEEPVTTQSKNGKKVRTGIENGIMYSIKYKVSKNKDYNTFPKLISDSYKDRISAYIKLPDTENGFVYYQKIGNKPVSGAQYQYEEKVSKEGYLLNKAFPGNILVRSVEDNTPNEKGTFRYASDEVLAKKSDILIKNYSDITRMDALVYGVKSRKNATKSDNTNKKYIYTLSNSISLNEVTTLDLLGVEDENDIKDCLIK